ncbi:MAG TPA: alpha/beta hydrolase [Polyangiaceae bacterium]
MTSVRAPDVIGYELVGTGTTRVVIMNDWLCDTSTWDGTRAYLDCKRFTYVFADLRGYGRSMGHSGSFTLPEAATDALALAKALHWDQFSVVGHSMSALVALHLAQHHPDRIERAVALTPPPPTGFGADDAALSASRGLALADDAKRFEVFSQQFGTRLSPGWASYKASRWRACANPVAAAAYVAMFARDGLPEPAVRITVPVLAITGEQDAAPMRSDAVSRLLTPLCEHLTITPLRDSGHYPMQEMPPLTVAIMERFLGN